MIDDDGEGEGLVPENDNKDLTNLQEELAKIQN